MKQTFNFFVFALIAATVFACAKEPEQVEVNTNQETVTVNVKMGLPVVEGTSKAVLSDELGITWEAGDVVWFNGNTGNVEAVLDNSQITDEGHTATFSIEIPAITGQDANGLLRYNWSLRNSAEYDFGNPTQHKIADNAATWVSGTSLEYTQAEAGVMNKAYLFMHSNTSRNAQFFAQAASSPVDVTVVMKIIGSVFRIMPYSTVHNDEEVQSVSFRYNNGSALGGTVVYDYVNGTYRDAQAVNWLTYKTVTVNLGTPFSLSGVTDKRTSKGIYFAVPATSSTIAGGYTLVVKTDQATYTYVSTNDIKVKENTVKNIPVLLDDAHRVADNAVLGDLRYEGSIANNQSFSYNENAQSNIDLGYWYARVKNTGDADWTTKENTSGNEGYYDVTFNVIDDATGSTADWLTVSYGANSTHWMLNATANTSGVTRTATVTASFPSFVDGYVLADGFATKTIRVSQTPELAVDTVIGDLSYVQNTSIGSTFNFGASAAANQDLGWLLICTRLTGESAWTGREANEGDNNSLYYAGITFDVIDDATGVTATWCTINRPAGNTRWYVTLTQNTGAARSATITAHFPTFSNHYELLGGESSTKTITINQASGAISYVTELWEDASTSIVKTWYSPAGWSGGLTPDVTLSADGTEFTSVIPEGIGGEEWMGQNFILSDILMNTTKNYKFSCTVNTTVSGTVTVKLGLWNPTGGKDGLGEDVSALFYANDVAVTAGTPLEFERSGFTGVVNGDFRVVLIIDLGRTTAGSTWTFSDISLMSN